MTETVTLEGVLLDATNVPPGSTLVLRFSPSLSQQQADNIKRRVSELAPDVKFLVVACDQIVVIAPEDEQ